MKYFRINKKRSLLGLGGGIVLLIVIIASYMVGRSYEGLTIPTSINVPAKHTLQPFSISGLSKDQIPAPPVAANAPNNANMAGSDVPSASAPLVGSAGQSLQPSDSGPQYLVKTLNVDLQVKETRKVADDLQAWITRTDPHASTSGTDYEQVGDSLYNISLTFSVQATLYPQIYRYLRDYTQHNGGRLATFNESIQDVTSTYVDTQSRLQNLRVEQGRLQDLLSHAQALSDILSIDQRLTSVEGQIESYETQLKSLTSQVTFYTVSVSLEPIDTAANNGWSISQVLHDAFSTSLAFGQRVIELLVYLVAFSFYIVVPAIIIWLAWKWYKVTRRASRPKGETKDVLTSVVNEVSREEAVPVNEVTPEECCPSQ